MSVAKSERGTSKLEYLYQARLLEKHTIQKCTGFPKRYTFYVSQPLANLATEVYTEALKANSIYPTTKAEARQRRAHLLEAKASLSAMVGKIELAAELFDIDSKKKYYWMELVDKEFKLLNGLLQSDARIAKELPD